MMTSFHSHCKIYAFHILYYRSVCQAPDPFAYRTAVVSVNFSMGFGLIMQQTHFHREFSFTSICTICIVALPDDDTYSQVPEIYDR